MLSLAKEFRYVLKNNAFINYDSHPLRPITVMIGTTNLCNLKCLMCGTKNIRGDRGFINWNTYKRIVDQCVASRVNYITLHTIGEPLLHRDLIRQINYAKQHKLHVLISTNGQLLNSENIEKLLQTDLDVIRISIDGADKETYESIRVGGNYSQLIHNLKLLKRLRDKLKSPLRIYTSTILMDKTSHKIKRQKNVLSSIADDYYFMYLANPGSQVNDIQDKMYMKPPTIKYPCRLLWRTMSIDFNGNVSACCLDFDQQLLTGNIMEEKLSAIWTNDIYRRYRELHREKRFSKMPLCGACNKDVNSPKSLLFLNLRIKLNLNHF